MNELKSLLDDVKNLFNQNIEGKYAKSYEESEIAEQDTTVINELNNYRTEVNSFKTNCVECKNYSDNYNYSNTSKNLSTLISSITTYETICNNVVEDIKTASREAFDEVNQSFMQIESLYRAEISEADSAYTDAVSARSRRNDCINDSEEYNKWDRQYSRLKNECRRHINNAKDKYMQLNDFILSEGMKRVNVDGLQEDISLQSDSSNREKTYTDEDGNLVTETYDESGRIISKFYNSESDGQLYEIHRYTYGENGEVIETVTYGDDVIREKHYYHYDGDNLKPYKSYSFNDDGYVERTYNENGETKIRTYFGDEIRFEETRNEKGITTEFANFYSDDHVVREFYSDDGQKIAEVIINGDSREEYSYDTAGRLVESNYGEVSGMQKVEYAYDESGRLITKNITYSNGKTSVEYIYDEKNLSRTAYITYSGGVGGPEKVEQIYDEYGNIRSMINTYSDGTVDRYDY